MWNIRWHINGFTLIFFQLVVRVMRIIPKSSNERYIFAIINPKQLQGTYG